MTFGGFQTSWGKIYTYYNLKVAFLVAVFIFELGSLVCGVAPNMRILILGWSTFSGLWKGRKTRRGD